MLSRYFSSVLLAVAAHRVRITGDDFWSLDAHPLCALYTELTSVGFSDRSHLGENLDARTGSPKPDFSRL